MSQALKLSGTLATAPIKMQARGVSVFYGAKQALTGLDIDIPEHHVTSLIGPSGCGKTTFLRCINRMNDIIDGCRVEGHISIDGVDIYSKNQDVVQLRARVGMVFQKPNPFPKSIYENVAYGPRIHGMATSKKQLDEIVIDSLTRAGLIKEVHDRLDAPGTSLSGGQQQRLCIARTIAVKPELILIDELREHFTIVIVTHSMQQAARVSQRTAFFHMGELVEAGPTEQIFTNPKDTRTQAYITGRIG